MHHPPQPWYRPHEQQQPVPDNPYAPGGYTPPEPPPRRRRFGKGPLIATVVALALVAASGWVYALADGRWGGPTAPVADKPAGDGKAPGPSVTPTPSRTPAARTPTPQRVPTSEELNAGREAGDAIAWIADDRTDLPRRSVKLYPLWIVGDAVVQAGYEKVTARRLSDGTEKWSVPLPASVCEVPNNPTPDGKIVVVYKSNRAWNGNRCNQLQMIDLRTGKAGWRKRLTETGSMDGTITVNSAISGGTLAIVQSMKAAAYRVDTGAKLYDIPLENPGKCYPDNLAGGTRLVVSSTCAISVDRGKSYHQLRELDPRTGKVRWRYRTQPGWSVGKMLSVDPVVFTTYHHEKLTDDWRVVALKPGGKLRITIDARPKGFTYCAGAGDSGGNMQLCPGTAVGKDIVFLGGIDRVGGYSLDTGKLVWGVKSSDSTLHPLRADGGPYALVYEAASADRPGGIIRFGPGSADTKKQVLLHPETARAVERRMLAGRLAYANGRIVISPSGVSGNDADHQPRMLSFAPGSP
ncbi:PQQ-binding-like beta-propeller repeat protein [Streptomyces exfoliatus]|uniref:outer membrane protein assembly factor BamB family protein n=1 Tax=Streptomyces exfoliatus TaxID=1905 RepID=UPI0004630522|nr:PQQ-binding-like beta-propeller repeat protein [Streptomyces exfoliatus]